MNTPFGKPQEFSQRHSADDVARLVRLMDRVTDKGFRLAVIEERDEQGFRSALEWLEKQARAKGGDFCRVDLRNHGGRSVLDALGEVSPKPISGVLALRGLHLAFGSQDRVPTLVQLNVQRDLLVKRYPCFWALLVSPYVARRLREEAPDFSDFASLWIEAEDHAALPSPASSVVHERRATFGDSLVPFSHPDLERAGAMIHAWELDMARDQLAMYRLKYPEAAREHPMELLYLEAAILKREGAIHQARRLLQQEKTSGTGKNETHFGILADLLLAEMLADLGEIREAFAVIAACETAAAGWPLLAAGVAYARGDLRYWTGEWDSALADMEMAKRICLAQEHHRDAAVASGRIADILQLRGEVDEALRIRREEELPVYERLRDKWERAVTMGKVADILLLRGEVDEALRIRREEQLPVFERFGDARSRAVTMGKIADILQSRGELMEALRIRREEELPAYERLRDKRERAVTMGKIADILEEQGEVDEALRIFRDEAFSVLKQLGDVRAQALVMGKIADILEDRGEVDEALRIRREEQLPVFERLGDAEGEAACRWRIGRHCFDQEDYRGAFENWDRAYRLSLKLGQVDGIAAIGMDLGRFLRAGGQDDRARDVFTDALSAAERLGWSTYVDFFRQQLEELTVGGEAKE